VFKRVLLKKNMSKSEVSGRFMRYFTIIRTSGEVSVGHRGHSRHTGHGHVHAGHSSHTGGRRHGLTSGSSDEEGGGLFDLLSEFTVVGHEGLGLVKRQVNEHTSNLGGKLRSLELGDEIEDSVTDGLLEMGVVSLEGRDDLGGLLVEGNGGGVLGLGHHGSSLGVSGSGKLNGVLLHVSLSLVSTSGLHLLHLVLATHVVHGASGVVTLGSLVVVTVVSVLEVSVTTLVLLVLARSSHLLETTVSLHGEGLQELGDLVVELVSGGDVLPVVVLVVELLELLETELILSLFVLDLSELLEFVMADLELSLVEESVVAVLEGLLGLIGSLEADESVGLLLLVDGEHLDALDFSVLLEDTLEVLFVELGLEVLDVEVASLLGVLVLDGLTEELFLSLGGSKGGLDVKDLTVTHVSSVKSFDGFESLLGSVLVIVLVLRHVADESEFTVGVVNLGERGNVSEGSEEVLQVFVREVVGVVLNVEVVEHTSDVLSVLGVPLDGDALLARGGLVHHFAGLGGILGGLVTDETVSAGSVVLVHGDLEGLDGVLLGRVERGHSVIELSGSHILTVGSGSGDFTDEDVAVLVGLGEVGSEEGVIESETSARLSSDVEVSQVVGGLLVHFFILNAHNTGVEWLSGVSADLGLVLELNTGVLEKTSE
jgi:hypothetical protein